MIKTLNFIFVVLFVASVTEARIKFKKLEITSDPNFIKMEYKVEERDNKPYLTSTTEVLQDLDGEIMIHGNVSAAHNGQVEPITKILPIDLCKFLKGEKKSVLLNIVWNDLGKFGNIPKECPIKKQTVTIKDFTPDKDMIPAALPGGEYHVNILGELWRDGKMVALLEHVVVHATIDQ